MVFQTANLEAVRAATEIASQLQREDTFRKVISDRMAEDNEAVRRIDQSNSLRAEERQERQQRQSEGQHGEDESGEGDESEKGANFADGGVDFLA
jgi:hypothetical protein